VTLYATGDSITRAKLRWIVAKGYEEDQSIDPKVAEYRHISKLFEEAEEFDLIHNHFDFMPLTYSRLVSTPVLTTIHGFSSPSIMPIYRTYSDGYFVSISDSDRAEGLNYLATVHNGIDLGLHEYFDRPGQALVFLGRIHPDKGVHLAVETATRSGRKLILAGIIQDDTYFKQQVEPWIDQEKICYVGPVGPTERNALFRDAYAVLHLNTLNERFGLVLAEANASGIPVIAMDRGSCREVIRDGETGFLVRNVDEALDALERIPSISRQACRDRVAKHFSIDAMVAKYEQVYDSIFQLQERARQAHE
jgi:glycosyltransferase involved in cell wall biosynthesis